MPTAVGSQASPVGRVLAWWGRELAAVLPGTGRTPAGRLPSRVISIEGSQLRLIDRSGTARRGAAAARPVTRQDLLAALSGTARADRDRAIALRLPYAACFVRRVELPMAAPAHIPRLLALDLERNSPFASGDILSAYMIEPRPGSASDRIVARQLIIKRSAVADLVADAEAAGLEVARIDCWNEDGTAALPVDFLASARTDADEARPGRGRRLLLALAPLALAATAGYIASDRHAAALAGLESRTAGLKGGAQSGREAQARARADLATFAAVRKARRDYVGRARMLEELTTLLPDTAWISELRIEGGQVDISGHAASAADLVRTLDRSRTFAEASLTAPVTFDQGEGKERFSLRVRLREAAQPPPPPDAAHKAQPAAMPTPLPSEAADAPRGAP